MAAVQAIAAARSNWHQPSANPGRTAWRASSDPKLLPMPRPTRNTARIMENVYTVAPSSSDSRRVQITSAPRAPAPDRAMVTCTGQKPRCAGTVSFSGSVASSFRGVKAARPRLIKATVALIMTAT